jgi:hypothetical protein
MNFGEALDAVGLAKEVASAAIEREGLLVAIAGSSGVGKLEGDVAKTSDAVGRAKKVAGGAEKRKSLLIESASYRGWNARQPASRDSRCSA